MHFYSINFKDQKNVIKLWFKDLIYTVLFDTSLRRIVHHPV